MSKGTKMLYVVIMAGGAGTRFWPASRRGRPKQLLDLTGGRTMIQATVDRLKGLVDVDQILIVTNEQLVPAIHQQLPDLPASAVLGEPCKSRYGALHRCCGPLGASARPRGRHGGHAGRSFD